MSTVKRKLTLPERLSYLAADLKVAADVALNLHQIYGQASALAAQISYDVAYALFEKKKAPKKTGLYRMKSNQMIYIKPKKKRQRKK